MKRVFLCIILVATSLSLVSCAALKGKFIRKPKDTKKTKEIFQSAEDTYLKDILYNNHFIYWKSWQGELISNIGKNNKKVLACANRALYNLTQMQELLKPEKQKELQPYIDELANIAKELRRKKISVPRQKKIINILNHHLWDVQRDFDYEAMTQGQWIQEN